MAQPIKITQTKVEVLLKNPYNNADLSVTRLDFLKSSVEIRIPYLFVHTHDESSETEFSITTRLFNLNEVSAYKEYNKITKK